MPKKVDYSLNSQHEIYNNDHGPMINNNTLAYEICKRPMVDGIHNRPIVDQIYNRTMAYGIHNKPIVDQICSRPIIDDGLYSKPIDINICNTL